MAIKTIIISSLIIFFAITAGAQHQVGQNRGLFQGVAPEINNFSIAQYYGVPQVNMNFGSRIDGFGNRPSFQTVFASAPLDPNVSTAFKINREKAGLTTFLSADLAFLYQLNISSENPDKIVFHVAGSFQQWYFDMDNVVVNHEDDPSLLNNTKVQLAGNATAGIAYLRENTYYFAVNVQQIIPNNNSFMNGIWENKTEMMIGGQASYTFKVGTHNHIQAYGNGLYVNGNILYDVGADFKFKQKAWIGAGYRENSSVLMNLGVTAGSFSFGYAFAFSSWIDAVQNNASYSFINNAVFIRKVFNNQKAVR